MATPTTCRGKQACHALQRVWNLHFYYKTVPISPKLPRTQLFDCNSNTILYLAYGSNLSAESFKGNRGIKPLSAVNVHVPTLSLTFDLPGIPYMEPCFANTCYRNQPYPSNPIVSNDYRKDRWQKGLIGVVYEVTPEDYRTIIATEGGGASYQDVVVECYELSKGDKIVDQRPRGVKFRAHTLLLSRDDSGSIVLRPDPSYAQASARYLKLITDGAEEHSLPDDYLAYLYSLRPYTITTYRQQIGKILFLGIWGPWLAAFLGLSKMLADKDGKMPAWLAMLTGLLFRTVWRSYDIAFKNTFGDGERTIEKEEAEESHLWRGGEEESENPGTKWSEKRIKLGD